MKDLGLGRRTSDDGVRRRSNLNAMPLIVICERDCQSMYKALACRLISLRYHLSIISYPSEAVQSSLTPLKKEGSIRSPAYCLPSLFGAAGVPGSNVCW